MIDIARHPRGHLRHLRSRYLASCALAMLAVGCAPLVAPARPATVAIPAQWSVPAASAPATPLARWWGRFNDPLLVTLVDDALAHNHSIEGARAALAQARALADVQAAARLPQLSGSASAQRQRANANMASSFAAGFDASWELDVFGGQRAAVRAADFNAAASAASLADIAVSVAAEVALDYLDLRSLQQRLRIARAALDSQQETLQLTRWRTQAGLSSVQEVEQARSAVEQTRAQLPTLDSAVAQAASSLAVLTGRAPGALREQLAAAGAAYGAIDPGAIVAPAVPAITLRQRPDVKAAEARVAAAAALLTQADAARLPDFSLGGSLGLSALGVAAQPNAASVVASLLARVSAPLLDGGAGQARVRAQQAALAQAGASYASTVLAALKDVEDGLVALANESVRLASLRSGADAAGRAAALAGLRYRSGLIDLQVVLDTQRVSLSAQDAVAISTSAWHADHVRLYKALGGGWQAPSPSAPQGTPGEPIQ
ncbi:efflux transporter outer membrane subunit [Massilia sp. DWR3-1-1]|uniref:efflux transporter outer membrane subunit n=1 Tax=Massilia sp. DWR3-1-1 TaxID=2804559 RepID=UPI003CF42840